MPPGRGKRKRAFERAERLQELPPYLFVEIDRRKREAEERGIDLVDLGIGDPDLPTPPEIVETLRAEAPRPENHRYPSSRSVEVFSQAAAAWFKRRYGVEVDARTHVLPVIGTKEGLAHFPLAFVNPGDVVLVPDPAYPVYHAAALLAGGEPHRVPLTEENRFLPDLGGIEGGVGRRARILFLNYPNNPTAAVADGSFYREAVQFARENDVILVNDAAYSEISYDGLVCPSLLEEEGALDVGIEFHSFSKTYNMCGWRVGFAVGHPDLIAGLAALKANIDSHLFGAILAAAAAALEGGQSHLGQTLGIYRERRDILVDGLGDLGWKADRPRATFYVWVRVPDGRDSVSFATDLIERAGVVTAPGVGFGAAGEGYLRLSLTCRTERIRTAVERMRRAGFGRRAGGGGARRGPIAEKRGAWSG